ncbi:dihydrolipoyl dehydrogenase [Cerasicoccus arenae]|uniref:Dihydrolipoyl dehydrogenase n=1 Tax=Cerasicoccus arenae TaxID=424488 RepID=A0A8J3D9R2_9BACT|nr:dihydrolipoyl dehydrogenase [Cerasicoccus arenae]MBK1858990.1 dihydrolipoyl dehydrogenase [Cerasicoccus arenae]GHB94554.1 dihydrolipoyl dehydrogenase [Cerasicoccus arenae]
MADTSSYDLVVIGGGPAGYAGAIRAGQLGKKVACVEMERAGGTCLNWGCIPSKALLKSAELYQKMLHADDFGFNVGSIDVDFPKVVERSRSVANQMAKGIEFLFKKNKVDYIVGQAQINVPGMVELISGDRKGEYLSTKNILIATGCRARMLPGLTKDGKQVMTAREILDRRDLPKSCIVMGAGAIGMEFAYFLNAFGSDVTVVEMMDRVLPVEDDDVSKFVEKSFKKQGLKVMTGTKAENITVADGKVTLDAMTGDKTEKLEAESLLVAIGVQANTDKLLSNRVKLEMHRNYVKVDAHYRTSVKGIYAAGDIIGPPWLAHVATYEAVQAVNGMFDHGEPRPYVRFPGCTYCQPQVASIGMTERDVKAKELKYKVGKFPFTASGKAVAAMESEGFVKLIVSEPEGEILGAHITGAEATELIAEYALGMELEATWEEIHGTIHAHPTLSEALMEAAAATHNEAIHI